ncbi:MAG: OmpH family outer membrane protein [Spirochaetaceae bacterium]|nr:OmpH family outer membrane protein [Spirochaetaceae bacterium]
MVNILHKSSKNAKIAAGAMFVFCTLQPLFPQQITRFAVVDFNRVLTALNVRTNAYVELEKKAGQVQEEINKRKQEIDGLQEKAESLQKSLQEAADMEAGQEAAAEADPFAARPAPRSSSQRSGIRQQEAELTRLRSDIIKKTEALKDYFQKKTAELESERRRISSNTADTEMINQINAQISLTAESEGYTMVLDKSTKGIIWYSRSVDITDKVISALLAKIKRP